MSDEVLDLADRMDRRGFLEKGAGAFAAAAALGDDKVAEGRPSARRRKKGGGGSPLIGAPAVDPGAAGGPGAGGQPANGANPDPTGALPRRKLGRTGVDVTMLTLGTWLNPGGERLLR